MSVSTRIKKVIYTIKNPRCVKNIYINYITYLVLFNDIKPMIYKINN